MEIFLGIDKHEIILSHTLFFAKKMVKPSRPIDLSAKFMFFTKFSF